MTAAEIAAENQHWQDLLTGELSLSEFNGLIPLAVDARERGNPKPAQMLSNYANRHLWVFYYGKYREVEVLK